ncbi:hypothetical protein [Tsuneonella dongtanensis]|nr:hypothetical protein [Tsuneonella dongtanensis]
MIEEPEFVSPFALAHFAQKPAYGPQFDNAASDRYGRELEQIARVEGTQPTLEVVLSQLAQFATPALTAADEQSRRCSFDWFAFAAEASAIRADLSATDDGSIFAASLRLSHNSANRSAIQRQYERIDERRPDPPTRKLGRPGEWRSSSIHSPMRAMGLGPLIAYPRSQTHPNHRAGRARAVQLRMLVEFLVVLRFIEAVEMRANRYGLPFAIQLDAGSEYYSGPEALYSAQPMMARFVDCRVTTGDPRAREAFRQYREDELTRYDAETEKFALAMVDTYERYGYLPWQWLPEDMDELRKRLAGVQWTLPPSKSPDQPSPEEVGKLIEMFRAQRAGDRPAGKPPIV